MHEKHRNWLDGRMIDPTLAEKFGIGTVQKNGVNWLSVPYLEQGKPINHKYRTITDKRHMMDQNAPLTLWNVDTLSHREVLEGSPVIITEGEWDALTALTAGVPHVVSVPNGAPQKSISDPENAKRYSFIWRNKDALDKVKIFIIATDADEPGRILAADLVSLLGAVRCKYVQYPADCKDLNDVANLYGHDEVLKIILSARPYPVKGLHYMSDFQPKPEVQAIPIGCEPLREFMAIVPGTLTVMTGFANMGKSTVLNGIMGDLVANNVPILIASFETEVKPILQNGLRLAILGCSQNDMYRRDTSKVDELLQDNVCIVHQSVDEDEEMDIDAFLDYCEIAVVRDGVKAVFLDPWNELEHKRRRDESETEYIGRALRSIKKFARQHNVAFWVVAHPTKPHEGKMRVPGLYDISGSANWANKADYGLVYHRPVPDKNEAELRVVKVRMGLPGKKGSAKVYYDFRYSKFVSLSDGDFAPADAGA